MQMKWQSVDPAETVWSGCDLQVAYTDQLSGLRYGTSFLEPERPINIYSDAYIVVEYWRNFHWQLHITHLFKVLIF